MVTITQTQEPSRKRLKTNNSEVKKIVTFKDDDEQPTSPKRSQKKSSQQPTVVSFMKKSQSVLSVTDFKEPLKLQTEYPIPELLHPHEILVHNKAIGLNPVDWKGKKYGFGIYHFPWINGRESSGTVVKLGEQVTDVKIGDDVIVSSTSYRDTRTSTFQQYTAIDSRLVWKLPKEFSYEDGATIGVGLVTAGVILFNSFGFELAKDPKKLKGGSILIWGGATVVGIYLTQLAKLYGLTVISIAGLSHEKYLKSLGADYLIDRHLSEEEITEKVKEVAGEGGIQYGVDCVSKQTSTLVLNILDSVHKKDDTDDNKAKFAGIVGVPKEHPESVEIKEVIIKRFHEDISFGKEFIEITSDYLETEKIKPVRYRQYKGGLHIIDEALKDLENKGAKGEKYVVSV
ncbi:uncharacterized protein J8A68_005927 [[Candida] subhashii]|uniref:Enoyl reductase (ER) domain-containing protein n=1 Tax=[Candida] subhashii TaxID=561895 RepID=A0A8J5QCZ5_9ASCO|nr:uncharacterized protein J8A68_005927 [[Candida] subhashii]KAG7660508.1 hypothetical protein J8A68_005927 [[Candida] subhashii]